MFANAATITWADSFLRWYAQPDHLLDLLKLIGGIIVALTIAAWAIYKHFYSKSQQTSLVSTNISGDATIYIGGVPAEMIVSEVIDNIRSNNNIELSEPALRKLLTTILMKETLRNSEAYDAVELASMAINRISSVYKHLNAGSSDDLTIHELRRKAKEAIANGSIDDACHLLKSSCDLHISLAKQKQDTAQEHLRSAALTKADLGDLQFGQLSYLQAANLYEESILLLPLSEQVRKLDCMILRGSALFEAGLYQEAKSCLLEAISVCEEQPILARQRIVDATIYLAQVLFAGLC